MENPKKQSPPGPKRKRRKGFTIEDGVQLRRRVTTRKRRQTSRRDQTPGKARTDTGHHGGTENVSGAGSSTCNNTNEHPIRDGVVAGSIAGSIADIFMYPFDTVNTRQKVKRSPTLFYRSMTYTAINILQKEGIKGWFGGVSAAAISALPSNAVYFGSYEFIKSQSFSYFGSGDRSVESTTYLVAGALSELTSSVVYTPFEVVKTRMQLGETWINEGEASPRAYKGTFNAFQTILKSEGFLGLYSGYKACILTDCTYSALQFLIYEKLKHRLALEYQKKSEDIVEFDDTQILIIGGLAGGIASVITNPLDTFTARLMTQQKLTSSAGGGYYYEGILDCCRKMYKEEGLLSLYQGWQPRMIRFTFLAGITFTIYERVKWILGWQDEINGNIDDF